MNRTRAFFTDNYLNASNIILLVVSRNKFLSLDKVASGEISEIMKKLNQRKIRWIIRELRRGQLSIYQISRIQKVSPRWVRQIPTKYKGVPLYKIKLRKCGRKPKPITDAERQQVMKIHEEMPMGSSKIEIYLKTCGLPHIPHNRIHSILHDAGKVQPLTKKIKRKKWVRYERHKSDSLWHGDYCEIDGMHVISFIDDASRFVAGWGMFENATTDNALSVLEGAVMVHGIPKQVMTDHGTQFCSDEEKVFRFSERLKLIGIEHIMSAVKRPQSNGKIERWFGTVKKLYSHFGNDMGRAVACYNGMPHLSLSGTPAEVYLQKKGNC